MMNDALLRNISFLSARVKRFDLSPAVLSIIATEMYFRNSLYRLAEYFAWIVLWHMNSKKVEMLSVGIAQIQIKLWVELGFIRSCRPSISNLLAVAKVENNYMACQRYLGQVSSSNESNAKMLSELYSGKARIFHSKAIARAYEAAVRISLTKASSRRAKCARD
jgi:hypothetical protein